jgi:hypothetical protein
LAQTARILQDTAFSKILEISGIHYNQYIQGFQYQSGIKGNSGKDKPMPEQEAVLCSTTALVTIRTGLWGPAIVTPLGIHKWLLAC